MDPYYEARYTFDDTRAQTWQEIISYLQPYLPAHGAILDLGAGYCDFINNVTSDRRYAVDWSPELKKFAASGVTAITANVWDLSAIDAQSLDVVFASNLLEHLDDTELTQTMSEVKRVLKKDGLFIAMQPNYRLSVRTYFDDPTHKKVFSDAALCSFLVYHGLRIKRVEPRFLPFSLKSRPQ